MKKFILFTTVFLLAFVNVARSEPLAHIELGPGAFTTMAEADGAEASGVIPYVGAGAYISGKLSATARVSFIQESQATTLTELWAFLNYYPGGVPWGQGPYISVGVGTEFDGALQVGAHGGYQISLFSDAEGQAEVLGFLEAEGRMVNQTDVDSEAQANLGLRGNFGRR